MDIMNNWLTRFAELIGSSVCHQLAYRSFWAGTVKIPVCARCEGIYAGFFISAIFLFCFFRKKQGELPPLYIIITLALFILSAFAEWGFSFFSLFESTNISRFITGYLAGSASMTIVFPVFNYQYYSDAVSERIFPRLWQFAVFISVSAVFITMGLAGITVINNVYYYVTFISILFTFYFTNLVIVLLFPVFAKKAHRLFSGRIILPSLISLILSGIELYISYLIHQYVAGL